MLDPSSQQKSLLYKPHVFHSAFLLLHHSKYKRSCILVTRVYCPRYKDNISLLTTATTRLESRVTTERNMYPPVGREGILQLGYLWQAISSDSSIPNSSPSHVGHSEVDVPFHILSPPPFPTRISINLHQSTSQLVNRLTINQGISQSVDRSINHSTLLSLLVRLRAHNSAHYDETSQILRGPAEEHLETNTDRNQLSATVQVTLAMVGGTRSCDWHSDKPY